MKRIILILTLLFFMLHTGTPYANGAMQVQNLPITIINPVYNSRSEPVAIIISGDGGWYKFEQAIADKLAGIGVPTIGLDTKKYFWNRRTPEETASDIAASIEYYNKVWQRNKFLFIGYSLGAELLPFIINKLPESLKSKISMFVLLSPAATTDFQIHYADMLGVGSRHNTYKVIDEISKIRNIPALFIFGADEKTKVPAMLTGTPVSVVTIPGDHHYNHDTALIVKTLKDHNAF
jgi:type IV secretory pathway VirJ component